MIASTFWKKLIHGAMSCAQLTFSDSSVLTRYGIATVNYGTSTGLLDEEYGENLDIDGLAKMAKVYALAAASVCGVVA